MGPIEIAGGATAYTPTDDSAIEVGNWRSATIVVDVLKNPNSTGGATINIQTATTTPLGPYQYTDPTKRFTNTATSGTTIALSATALGAQLPITVTNLADLLRATLTGGSYNGLDMKLVPLRLQRHESALGEERVAQAVVDRHGVAQRPGRAKLAIDALPGGSRLHPERDETAHDEAPALPVPKHHGAQAPPDVGVHVVQRPHLCFGAPGITAGLRWPTRAQVSPRRLS